MKHRVLFICVGNSCRSQMAEGFAKAYGHDVLEAYSGGLSPAMGVDTNTKAVMAERNISLDDQCPKPLEEALRYQPSLLINMSGSALPTMAANIATEVWPVRDPVGEAQMIHREVRDAIEGRIMQLILRLRQMQPAKGAAGRFKFGRMG